MRLECVAEGGTHPIDAEVIALHGDLVGYFSVNTRFCHVAFFSWVDGDGW
jgi:hypothetical protein